MLFYDRLRQRHGAKLHISGRVRVPQFVPTTGFWESGGKATRAIVHLRLTDEGAIECSLPPQYNGGVIRLGQHNLSSAGSSTVWAFTLMAAIVEDGKWRLLEDFSWLLAFRLASVSVTAMATAFAHQSVSSIAFHFNPITGALSAQSTGHSVPCQYYSAGLLLNDNPGDQVGVQEFTYEDVTTAIHQVLGFEFEPLPIAGE